MPYDEQLADRIRIVLRGKRNIEEKKMFGSVCFLLHGNICCGVFKKNLILRLGVEEAEIALLRPHVGPFDVTGRPMTGWAMLKPAGMKTDDELQDWISRAWEFVKTLPAK
ncbi:hypothetical protein Pla110_12230 [Polystyrenella longa]|uniref:TfoX N-terminal domain-containing protein n=1 Tax=Polystyrenella longa TaxID=2528007 RepID=A0A518CJV5_9PLAN|nr:TfoX/Sxy family protein [Polystyrenella longa]QDU79513.1 hypothetical protein Pla110_12230 [Polystyrenella longa]